MTKLSDNARAAYAHFRGYGQKAHLAWVRARRLDAEEKPKRYYNSTKIAWRGQAARGGVTSDDGLFWCEDPEGALGLRFCGLAHEIAELRHTGHYCDIHQDETMCGVVYRLPARNGKAGYMLGHADPFNRDKNGRGPARLEETVYWAEDDDHCNGTLNRCAKWADGIAERVAESDREYSAAYEAGCSARMYLDQAADARREYLALKKAKRENASQWQSAPSVAIDALKRQCRALLDDYLRAKESAQNLANGDGAHSQDYEQCWYTGDEKLVAAFNDGMGSAA